MNTKSDVVKDRRNPLKTARGLGSSQSGVGHWWIQRVTAAALVVLGIWFVFTVLHLLHADYASARAAVAQRVHHGARQPEVRERCRGGGVGHVYESTRRRTVPGMLDSAATASSSMPAATSVTT